MWATLGAALCNSRWRTHKDICHHPECLQAVAIWPENLPEIVGAFHRVTSEGRTGLGVSASQGSPNVAHSSAHCAWDARSQGLGTEQAVHVLNFLCSPGDSLGPLEAGSLLRLYPVLDTRKPHGRCEIKVLEKCSYGLAAGAALEWGPCVKKGLHEAPASTA